MKKKSQRCSKKHVSERSKDLARSADQECAIPSFAGVRNPPINKASYSVRLLVFGLTFLYFESQFWRYYFAFRRYEVIVSADANVRLSRLRGLNDQLLRCFVV